MDLRLAGQRLARVLVDFDIYLEFESGDTVQLSEFSIHTSKDSTINVGYDNVAEGLAAVLPFIGSKCVAAEYDGGGALTVIFYGGARISAPHSDGEAWEFSSVDGRRVISGPGGDLTTW